MTLKLILCFVTGCLLGSLSGALIVSRIFYKIDIRKKGSGNAGLTNSIRIFGAAAGVATAAIDILKTVAAMLIAERILPEYGILAAGLGAVLGHAFPVFFGFKGGKSAVCTMVVGFFIDYRMVLIALAFFAAVLTATGIMSAATISGMIAAPTAAAFLELDPIKLACVFVCCAFVIFMHRSNIKRILNKTEKRIINWVKK